MYNAVEPIIRSLLLLLSFLFSIYSDLNVTLGRWGRFVSLHSLHPTFYIFFVLHCSLLVVFFFSSWFLELGTSWLLLLLFFFFLRKTIHQLSDKSQAHTHTVYNFPKLTLSSLLYKKGWRMLCDSHSLSLSLSLSEYLLLIIIISLK